MSTKIHFNNTKNVIYLLYVLYLIYIMFNFKCYKLFWHQNIIMYSMKNGYAF